MDEAETQFRLSVQSGEEKEDDDVRTYVRHDTETKIDRIGGGVNTTDIRSIDYQLYGYGGVST